MKQFTGKFLSLIALACFLTVSLAACGQKISEANFGKIEKGMSRAAVYKILGDPTEADSAEFAGLSGTSARWTGKDAVIWVQFFNDKVMVKHLSRSGS